jgi:hypothetical protein
LEPEAAFVVSPIRNNATGTGTPVNEATRGAVDFSSMALEKG